MKKALVTGASRGIGKGIAAMLASEGYELFLVCKKNLDIMNSEASKLSDEYGVPVHCYQGDVSDSSFIESVFSGIDTLDVLVNNAGVAHMGLLQDMTDDEWRKIMGTNLDSVFYCSRAAANIMVKAHAGRIINISSVWGSVGASYETAYSASKAAVDGLTKALAKELAPSGIAVNAISCGLIDTDMNKMLSEEELKEVIEDIPIGRAGTPEDIAGVVKSVLDAPLYMTGQIIKADGGWI